MQFAEQDLFPNKFLVKFHLVILSHNLKKGKLNLGNGKEGCGNHNDFSSFANNIMHCSLASMKNV